MKAFGKKSTSSTPIIVHDHSKKGLTLNDTQDNFGHDDDLNLADTKLLTYFQNSSFGIFHIDSGIRMMCLKLTEKKEAYEELVEMRKAVN